MEEGQVIEITEEDNNKRTIYDVYDDEMDDDLDIKRRRIVMRKNRDEPTDISYKNIGSFEIYTNINTSQTSITLNGDMEFPYTIDMYNEAHGTNYIGFNSIDIDLPTMPIEKINVIGIINSNSTPTKSNYINFGLFREIEEDEIDSSTNTFNIKTDYMIITNGSSSSTTFKTFIFLAEDAKCYYLFGVNLPKNIPASTTIHETLVYSISFNTDIFSKIKYVFYPTGYKQASESASNYILNYLIFENENYNSLNPLSFTSQSISYTNYTNYYPSFEKSNFLCINKKIYNIPLLEENQSN